MKPIYPLFISVFFTLHLWGQCPETCGPDLVLNGDFEEVNQPDCSNIPFSELFFDQSPVENWIGGASSTGFSNIYTPDYYNPECAAGNPLLGVNQSAAVGLFTITFPGDDPSEWMQSQLVQPLVGGQQYCISFIAFSSSEIGSPGDGLDVALLDEAIEQNQITGTENPTFFTPAYSNPIGEFIPLAPTEYSFTYCAQGGEEWIAFGNQNAAQTTTEQAGSQAYVIIDNVSLIETCTQASVGFNIEASQNVVGCDDCSTLQAVDDNGTVINVDWSDGLGLGVSTVDVCPDEGATYSATFTGTDCNGDPIDITEEILIEVDCNEELVVNLEGGVICPGETFTLEAEVSGGVPEYNFQWEPDPLDDSAGPFQVSPDQTTTYVLTVTDGAGAIATAEATVEVQEDDLIFDLQPEFDLCSGPVTIDATTEGAQEYLWSDGSTEATFTVSESGTYSVEVTGACETIEAETLVVLCDDLSVEVEGGSVCEGQTFKLEAIASGGAPPYTYSWTPGFSGESTYSVSPEITTNYTVTVVDGEGNSVDATATVTVINPDAEIDLGEDRFLCPDDTVVVDVNLGADLDYAWNTGSGEASIEITQGGVYSVTVETPCAILRDTIEFTEALPEFSYPREVTACRGDEVEIGPARSDSYEVVWSDGRSGERILVTDSGLFTGSLNSAECPSVPIRVNVELLNCDCNVYVPNAFTPNGDGLNDVFKVIPECDIETFDLRIFNRWGNEVFSANSPNQVWNGASADEEFFASGTVYVYILTVQPRNELFAPEPLVIRGNITVLR